MRWRAAAAALLLGLAAAGPARAQDGLLSGTLRTIKDRGTINLGVRDGAVPFAFRNPGGQAVGFSVDLCLRIAADAAQLLQMELLPGDAPMWQRGLRVRYVPVTADNRLRMVTSGEVDLECGSTTATEERAKSVAFSPVFFMAGTKLMVAADSGIGSLRDLGGKTVVAASGTTNSDVMLALAQRKDPAFTVVQSADFPGAFAMLAAGRAAAFASDDILLAGMLATRPDGAKYRVVGDFLSFEPYALVLRRDDAALAGLVANSFQRMAQEGYLRASYNRWFMDKLPTGQTMNLPISNQLVEIFKALGQTE